MSGITPACAGKSYAHAVRHVAAEDHPRVCGEKSTVCFPQSRRSGSPPRVRGKENGKTLFASAVRITPACAGKRIHLRSEQ